MTEARQDSLMAEDERLVCTQVARGESPHSQRAHAILGLDAGAALEEVADQSGLTPNQVKYWRGHFRTRRLGIFPDELVAAARQAEIEATVVDALIKDEDGTEAELAEPKKKKSAKKKAKKGGKAKKGKKGKKKGSKKKGKKKDAKGKKSKKK